MESGNSGRKPGHGEEIGNQVDLVKNCFKVPTMENLRMIRSVKNVKSLFRVFRDLVYILSKKPIYTRNFEKVGF